MRCFFLSFPSPRTRTALRTAATKEPAEASEVHKRMAERKAEMVGHIRARKSPPIREEAARESARAAAGAWQQCCGCASSAQGAFLAVQLC